MNNSIVDYLNSKGQASDFSSRSVLAKNSGITNYSGSADQNMQLLNTLRAKGTTDTPVSTSTNTNGTSAITVDQLSKATPIQTVQAPAYDPTADKNAIGSISGYIASNFQAADAKKNALLAEQSSNASKQLEIMKALSGKEADQQAANDVTGVNKELQTYTDLSSRLAELDARSKTLDRQAQAIPVQDQINADGKGITDAGLAPITAAQLRNNLIESLTVAQQADITSAAATGSYNKIQLAREKAQQIVDLKYKPLEADLAIRQKQYELNKDLLTSVDKTRTESLGAALELEQNAMANKKADDKLKADLITKAAPNAPQDLLLQAQSAPDSTTAAIILGKYAQDFLQQEKLKQEVIKLQIENGTYNPSGDVASAAIISKDNGFGLQDYKKGIQAVESAGSRDAYGGSNPYAVITGQKTIQQWNQLSAEEKNKLAYGKFQVLGSNIPAWTKEVLNKSMTIEQFMANPSAQEAVFDHFAEKEYAKYGNWGDVASVWFSGRPMANNNASDGGNTVPEYIQKVFKNMGVTSTPADVAIPGVPERVTQALKSGTIQPGQLVSSATGQLPKNITADKQDGLLALKDLVNKMDEYKTLYKQVQDNGVFGTGVATGIKNSIFPSTEVTALNLLRGEITDLLSRARSGAALSVVEEARYAAKLPTTYSADQLFGNPDTEIDGLKNSLEGTLQSKLTGYGAVFAPTQAELYVARMNAALNPAATPVGAATGTYNGYH